MLFGSVMFVRLVQSLKQLPPNDVMLFGSVILVRFVQP